MRLALVLAASYERNPARTGAIELPQRGTEVTALLRSPKADFSVVQLIIDEHLGERLRRALAGKHVTELLIYCAGVVSLASDGTPLLMLDAPEAEQISWPELGSLCRAENLLLMLDLLVETPSENASSSSTPQHFLRELGARLSAAHPNTSLIAKASPWPQTEAPAKWFTHTLLNAIHRLDRARDRRTRVSAAWLAAAVAAECDASSLTLRVAPSDFRILPAPQELAVSPAVGKRMAPGLSSPPVPHAAASSTQFRAAITAPPRLDAVREPLTSTAARIDTALATAPGKAPGKAPQATPPTGDPSLPQSAAPQAPAQSVPEALLHQEAALVEATTAGTLEPPPAMTDDELRAKRQEELNQLCASRHDSSPLGTAVNEWLERWLARGFAPRNLHTQAAQQLLQAGHRQQAVEQIRAALATTAFAPADLRDAIQLFTAAGDLDAAQMAKSSLALLGESTSPEQYTLETGPTRAPTATVHPLTPSDWSALTASAPPLLDLLVQTLGAHAIAAHFTWLKRLGVRSELFESSALDPTDGRTPIARSLVGACRLLGVEIPRLLVDDALNEAFYVAPRPVGKIAAVRRALGKGMSPTELSFLWGREVVLLDERWIAASVFTGEEQLLSFARASLSALGHGTGLELNEHETFLFKRCKRVLSRTRLRELEARASSLGAGPDSNALRAQVVEWRKQLALTRTRFGLMACGCPHHAARVLRRYPVAGASSGAQWRELLAFANSGEFARLRRATATSQQPQARSS